MKTDAATKEYVDAISQPIINAPLREGIHTNLSSESYHADKESISRSALMDFSKSPYTYWAKHLNPDRPKKDATDAMILGSAFHTMILELSKFDYEYAIMPPKVLLKDVGREMYDRYKQKETECEISGKKIIYHDEFMNLVAMRDRLQSNQTVMDLLKDARIENSFFWRDEHSGLMLKSRPDILHDNMIVDLKTCSDASPRAFQNSMVLGGYHIQGAMIRDAVERLEGRRINKVINICVETKYPYNTAIYIIDEFAIDEGHMKYKNLLLDLKNAIMLNEFIDYGIQTVSLPKWAL